MNEAVKVFQASYQICKPAPPNIAGNAWEYRRSMEEALVVAADPRELAAVIGANVELKAGEQVEILQWRQLARGVHAVFVGESKL